MARVEFHAVSPGDQLSGEEWQKLSIALDGDEPCVIRGFRFDSADTRFAALAGRHITASLTVERCTFEAQVDLAETRFRRSLRLLQCRFDQGLVLRDVTVHGAFSVAGSWIHSRAQCWLDWRRLAVRGICDLSRVTALGGIDLTNARLGDDLRLDAIRAVCRIRDKSVVGVEDTPENTTHVRNEMVGKSLNFEGAVVRGHVYCYSQEKGGSGLRKRWPRLRGTFDLRARIGGSVGVLGLRVVVAGNDLAVSMEGGRVGGAVTFAHQCRVTGTLNLCARIGRRVLIDETEVDASRTDSKDAIDLYGSEVGGNVLFTGSCRVAGVVDLRGKFRGNVTMRGLEVDARGTNEGIAIDLTGATVGGDVFLENRCRLIGRVSLCAKVRGDLLIQEIVSLASHTKNWNAIDLSGSTVGGSVLFRDCNVDASHTKSKKAISLERARIGGSLLFRKECRVKGLIDLRADVGGNVELIGIDVDASGVEDKRALDLERAVIKGILFLRGGSILRGSVVATMCRVAAIAGDTRAGKSHQVPHAGSPVSAVVVGRTQLDYSRIQGPVFASSIVFGKGLDLGHAEIKGDLELCGSVLGCAELATDVRFPGDAAPDPNAPAAHILRDATNLLAWSDAGVKEIFTAPPIAPTLRSMSALDVTFARVTGNLRLDEAKFQGHVIGEDAEVDGEFNMTDARLGGDLVLRSARVRGRIFADETTSRGPFPQVSGSVDLRNSELSQVHVRLDGGAGGFTPTRLLLDYARTETFNLHASVDAGTGASATELFLRHLEFGDLSVKGAYGRSPRHSRWATVAAAVVLLGLEMALGNHLLPQILMPESVRVCSLQWVAVSALLLLLLLLPGWRMSWRDVVRFRVWSCLTVLASATLLAGNITSGLVLLATYVTLCGVGIRRDLDITPRRDQDGSRSVLGMLQHANYSPELYVRVESWLRGQGDDATADEVYLLRHRRSLAELPQTGPAEGHTGAARRGSRPNRLMVSAWHWFLDISIGYGIRGSRPLHVFLLFWLINWGVFAQRDSVERPIQYIGYRYPHPEAWKEGADPGAAFGTPAGGNPWPSDGGRPAEGEWGAASAFFMALRVQLPIVNLVAEEEWAPSSRPIHAIGIKYENYAAVMMILNMLLLPVIIAAGTGILKRRF